MKKKLNKSAYPTVPSLIGKDVYLRPITPEDGKITYRWFLNSDPQSQTSHQAFLTTPETYAKRDMQKKLDLAHFLIVSAEDERPVGKVGYFNLNNLNRSAELSVIVSPEERKNGYAFESFRLLIGYLFNQLNLNKVYAQTGAFNKASIALLESLDFRLDGTLRQHHYYDGEYHDDKIYSLLKFEFAY